MVDLSKFSPVELERFIHLQATVDRQKAEASNVKLLRRYYDGDHPVMLTQRQQEFMGPMFQDGDAYTFSHNLVKTVIDTLVERLSVSGISVNGASLSDVSEDGEDVDTNAEAASTLWHWWVQNRMDSQQVKLYRRAERDMCAYVMVDYDNAAGRPRFTLQRQSDGDTGIVVHYDPEDESRILFANRYWRMFDPDNPRHNGQAVQDDVPTA